MNASKEEGKDFLGMHMRQAAVRIEGALPIGNGSMTARVLGHAQQERIALAWKNPEDAAPQGARLSITMRTRRALCRDYVHELDFDTAQSTVSFRLGGEHITRSAFVSRGENALAMLILTDAPEGLSLQVSLSAVMGGVESPLTLAMEAHQIGWALPSGGRYLGMRLIAEDGETAAQGSGLAVEGARRVLLIIAPDSLPGRRIRLPGVGYAALIRRHTALMRPLMRGLSIVLSHDMEPYLNCANEALLLRLDERGACDALLQRMYDFGRYLIAVMGWQNADPADAGAAWRKAALEAAGALPSPEGMPVKQPAPIKTDMTLHKALGGECADIAAAAYAHAIKRNAEAAYECLELMLRSCVGNNLLTRTHDLRAQGNARTLEGGGIPRLEPTGNALLVAVVTLMLAQRSGHTLYLLPAMPKHMARGHVRGLRLWDVEIDMQWDRPAGWIDVTLLSDTGGMIALTPPFPLRKEAGILSRGGGLMVYLPEGRRVRYLLNKAAKPARGF